MTQPFFLTAEELRALTGYSLKARQIAELRRMGIAFRLNGHGKPVVTRAAIDGGVESPQQHAWRPAVLQGGRNGR